MPAAEAAPELDKTPVSDGNQPAPAKAVDPANEPTPQPVSQVAFVAQIKISDPSSQEPALPSEIRPADPASPQDSAPRPAVIPSPSASLRPPPSSSNSSLTPLNVTPAESAPVAAVTVLPAEAAPTEPKTLPLTPLDHRPVAAIEAPSLPEKPTPVAPVRDISLRLPGPDSRGVDVRLTEKAGEVRIDVRSADPQLTENLRSNLHDLMNNLDRRGLTAEAWHPGTTSPLHTASAGEAELNQNQNGSGHDERGQQQNREQSRHSEPDDPDQPKNHRSAVEIWAEAIHNLSEDTRKP